MKSKNEVYDEYESCENSVWRDGTKKDKNFWFFNLYSVILVMLGLGAVVCSLIWSVMDKILDVIVAVSSVHANITLRSHDRRSYPMLGWLACVLRYAL
jgi:hypothetical protein